jgi:ankyrin repeat protein
MRYPAVLLLLAFCTPAAHAQAPAPLPPLPPEDARLVYTELASTHDGFVYDFYLARFNSEQDANASWQRLQEPRGRMTRFDKFYRNMTPRTAYLFALDPTLRGKIVSLYEGERTGPLLTLQGWVIVELIGSKPAPLPGPEEAVKFLPGLVASRVLPSAEELRTNPALRARTLLNAVRTVDDLRNLPADADINAKLSSQLTLLHRALTSRRLDFAEAVLKRGANPNLCAGKFCPLQLAIYGGMRPGVEVLLGAGADANQRDTSIGVEEGPLSAAAYVGNEEIAARLVAAGAKVDGFASSSAPLMSASTKANRAMAEFLISKGANVLAVTNTAPERTALDFAGRSGNSEYAAWLRATMLKKATDSGDYAWDGWIEQDGKRQRIGDGPVTLKRAPFRVITRMKPDATLFVSASTDRRILDEFGTPTKSNLRFNGSISFEGNEGKDVFLVVHGPMTTSEGWGGSQAWWHKAPGETRFASVMDTPQGREHIRRVEELVLPGDGNKPYETPVAAFKGGGMYLVLGTRVRMTVAADEVLMPRTMELRFRD